jgi:lactoylglutathione lyase
VIQSIATVAVYVEDQQKTLEFWTQKVGFEVVANHPMGPNASWIEVAPPGAQSRLVIYPKALMPDWQERKPSIVFECDDIQGTYERMVANGVKFKDSPKAMSWGTYATFEDTDGNEFLLKG